MVGNKRAVLPSLDSKCSPSKNLMESAKKSSFRGFKVESVLSSKVKGYLHCDEGAYMLTKNCLGLATGRKY